MKIPLCHCWVLWLPMMGIGASAASDPLLTLDNAVVIAIDAAPQLRARQAAIEVAQAASISAGRLPDPALVAGVENLPSNGIDAWSFERDFMTMRKIGVMQSFPSGRKRHAERESAQAMAAVAESQAAESQLEVSQSAAQAWVSLYVAKTSLEQLQALKPALALQVELARAAVASGGAQVSDALSAQAAAADLDDRLLNAGQEVAAARAELARWIGEAADQPLAPPPSFVELPGSAAEIRSSLHHHAALLAFDARIAAARSEIAVASAARRPDWSAELDYARRGPGFSDMVSLQFQVSLPLFPGTRQDPAIRARSAAVRQLEADRDSELRMHAAEVEVTLSDWQSARDRIELYKRERLPLARQRSELALAGLRAGRVDPRQALSVLSDQTEVELTYIELLKRIGHAWAYLHFLPAHGGTP
jgi:cobalt-zinc-cadmium efflux system outer membrane protein